MMEAVLTCSALTKAYGPNKALDNFTAVFSGGRTFHAYAIARSLHRRYDSLFTGGAFDPHAVGQKAYRAGRYARHLGYGLFHARAARCAAHAGYLILFHDFSPFLDCGRLAHQLAQGIHQLVNGFVLALTNVLYYAGTQVLRQQLAAEGIQRRIGRGGLSQNVGTIGALFQHAPNAANLSLDAVEAMYQAFVFSLGAFLGPMAAGGLTGHGDTPFQLNIPHGGI